MVAALVGSLLLLGNPSYLGCSRPLEVGTTIMSATAVSAGSTAVEFNGVACDAQVGSNTALTARFTGAGQFVLELRGGATFSGSSTCGGTRVDHTMGSSFTVDTTGVSGASISLVAASASGYGAVSIGDACTLDLVQGAAASALELRPASPPLPPRTPPPPTREPSILFWVHAGLMAIAWLVLVPTGVQVARHGKRAEAADASAAAAAAAGGVPIKEHAPAGPASWFVWHRGVQMSAVVLSLAGLGAIVVAVDAEGRHLSSTHSKLGATTLALMLTQAIGGLLRPSHTSSVRRQWQLMHRLVGMASWILAVVTSLYGALRLPAIEAMYVLVDVADDGSLLHAVLALVATSIGSFATLEGLARMGRSHSSASHRSCMPGLIFPAPTPV